MLYKLGSSDQKFDKLEPVSFKDFSSFGNLEKDLEELAAKSMPMFYLRMPAYCQYSKNDNIKQKQISMR